MEMNEIEEEEQLPETKQLLVELLTDDDQLFSVEVEDILKETKIKQESLVYYSRSISIISFIKNDILVYKVIDNKTGNFFHNYINPDRKMDSSHILNLINREEQKSGKSFEKSSF